MFVDGVLNRAIDEFDRLAVSLMALRTSGGDSSHTQSSSLSFPAEQLPSTASTPPSSLKIWVLGDDLSEMIAARSSLGVDPANIRCWNNMRSSDGPRPALLEDEKPDWLIINIPGAMRDTHPSKKCRNLARRTCSLVAVLLKLQAEGRRHFVMYGSPMSEVWSKPAAPELAKLYVAWYTAEFRWCNLGVKHPETGQGFDPTTKVLSSIPLWSGTGLSSR